MKRFIALTIASIMTVGTLSARIVRNYESQPATPDGLVLVVDSIDYRKEVTRIYGRLTGRPHTSNRIDNAALDGCGCTDIDGVDFNRYFQWEDDGQIPVELDFPPCKPKKQGSILIRTPRGQSTIVFSTTPKK